MELRYVSALRGLAILGVMFVHTGMYGTNHYNIIIDSLIYKGAYGVHLFFIASAFTLFISYNRRVEIERGIVRNFFIRRLFRIAPMYYLGIIYFLWQNGFGIRYWLGDAEKISIGNILSNISFIHWINPYWINSVVPGGWSITVEFSFYLLVPFLVKILKNLNQAIWFLIFSLIIVVLLNHILLAFPLIDHEILWHEYLDVYFPMQLPVFGFGIIAYFLVVKKDYSISPLTLFSLTGLFLCHLFWTVLPKQILFSLGFLLLLYTLSIKEFKLLVNDLTCYLGKISYSSYFVHFAILYWLKKFNVIDFVETSNIYLSLVNYILRLLIVITLTTVFASFLYRYLELPSQKLGKKLIKSIESKRVLGMNFKD